jgi:hypothetical protein
MRLLKTALEWEEGGVFDVVYIMILRFFMKEDSGCKLDVEI